MVFCLFPFQFVLFCLPPVLKKKTAYTAAGIKDAKEIASWLACRGLAFVAVAGFSCSDTSVHIDSNTLSFLISIGGSLQKTARVN